jgi:hypothetical protein
LPTARSKISLGEDSLYNFKPGQNLICKVVSIEPNGYGVTVQKGGKGTAPGFLPTKAMLRIGEEILAQFVTVHKDRVMLAAIVSNSIVGAAAQPRVRWEDYLDDIDGQPRADFEGAEGYQSGDNQGIQGDAGYGFEQGQQYPNPAYDPRYATSQLTPLPPQDAQFATGQQAPLPQQDARYSSGQQQPNPLQQGQYAPGPQGQQYAPEPPPDPRYGTGQQQPVAPQQGQQYAPQPPPDPRYGTGQQQPVAPQQYAPGPQPPPQYQSGQHGTVPQPGSDFSPPPQQSHQFGASFPLPRKFRLKRATDLIMPPLDESGMSTFKIADYDLEWLITDLEGGMRTGCVKASSEERLSRSAMLLFKGRAVGCIYGCKSMPDTQAQAIETSLKYMFRDLALPSTTVKVFDLPENITLAMSALFLGTPIIVDNPPPAPVYMEQLSQQLIGQKSTACVAITFSGGESCLAYFCQGEFCGTFSVEEQSFIEDPQYLMNLLRNDQRASVVASVLPPEMISSTVRFGHSLSMANIQSRGF